MFVLIRCLFSLTGLVNLQRRFCSNLGMTNQTVKAAQESVKKSEEFDIRLHRWPFTVLSLLFSGFIDVTSIHTWSFKHLWLQEESHIDCSSGYIHHNTALWWEEASSRSVPFTSCELKQYNFKTIADVELLADISVATGVAEGTIRNSYKDLYPHLPKIIPAWYAKEEDLKNLQSP